MKTFKTLTKRELISYYVDVLGMSVEDVKDSSKDELWSELSNYAKGECLEYNN